MMFMSGDWAGQSWSTLIFVALRNFDVEMEVCDGKPSCCKTRPLLSFERPSLKGPARAEMRYEMLQAQLVCSMVEPVLQLHTDQENGSRSNARPSGTWRSCHIDR
ncbi:unnamed protein product [Boreogadus saida]